MSPSGTSPITNDSGAVVYAAAHDPYGGVQKTWTSTYDPVLKFSGKERDAESGLDYFGARYYDKAQYRFISVDTRIILQMAQIQPLLRILYLRDIRVSVFPAQNKIFGLSHLAIQNN